MVQVGSIRLTLPVSDVVPAKASKSGQSASSKKSGASGVRFGGVSLAKASEMKPELHLRGLLVEEALEQLDKYLDDAVLAGLDRVRIIHGERFRAIAGGSPQVSRPRQPGGLVPVC